MDVVGDYQTSSSNADLILIVLLKIWRKNFRKSRNLSIKSIFAYLCVN